MDAKSSPIGYVPNIGEIDMTGLDIPKETMEKLFEINKEEWQAELKDQEEFFKQFGNTLPKEIVQEQKALEKRIKGI